MKRRSARDLVLRGLGLLLLTAAVLKGHELLTTLAANEDLWSWRPFLIFEAEFELALGLWLLFGRTRRRATRRSHSHGGAILGWLVTGTMSLGMLVAVAAIATVMAATTQSRSVKTTPVTLGRGRNEKRVRRQSGRGLPGWWQSRFCIGAGG